MTLAGAFYGPRGVDRTTAVATAPPAEAAARRDAALEDAERGVTGVYELPTAAARPAARPGR